MVDLVSALQPFMEAGTFGMCVMVYARLYVLEALMKGRLERLESRVLVLEKEREEERVSYEGLV